MMLLSHWTVVVSLGYHLFAIEGGRFIDTTQYHSCFIILPCDLNSRYLNQCESAYKKYPGVGSMKQHKPVNKATDLRQKSMDRNYARDFLQTNRNK